MSGHASGCAGETVSEGHRTPRGRGGAEESLLRAATQPGVCRRVVFWCRHAPQGVRESPFFSADAQPGACGMSLFQSCRTQGSVRERESLLRSFLPSHTPGCAGESRSLSTVAGPRLCVRAMSDGLERTVPPHSPGSAGGGGGFLRATAHPRVCGRAVFQCSRTPRGVRKSMFERRLRQGGAWEGPLGVPPQTLGCVPAPCECSRRPLLTATGGDRESTITFHRASLVMWQS